MGADISHLKQNGAKTNPDLVIVPPPTSHPQVNHDPNRPNRSMPKSHTTHFSDFSMFPDRFNGSSKPKPVAIVTHGHEHHHEEQPHFSDYSLYPDKLDQHKLKMHRSLSETPPAKTMDMNVGTSLPATGFISKYNFRYELKIVTNSSSIMQILGSGETPNPIIMRQTKVWRPQQRPKECEPEAWVTPRCITSTSAWYQTKIHTVSLMKERNISPTTKLYLPSKKAAAAHQHPRHHPSKYLKEPAKRARVDSAFSITAWSPTRTQNVSAPKIREQPIYILTMQFYSIHTAELYEWY